MIRFASFFLAGSLAFFCAGFLWTLGTDAGQRVIIKRQRRARQAAEREVEQMVRREMKAAREEREVGELVFFGRTGEARWTVQ